MKLDDRIRTMSGVSKRLFVALKDPGRAPPELEDALFQMASVIDSTSKHHFPKENSSKKRFIMYLETVMTDVYRIMTFGKMTITNSTFKTKDGSRTFGEIMYGIRCSSYHDPNEVDALVHWGENNQVGVNKGRFIINHALLTAVFLILISDEANKNHIDTVLFHEQKLSVNGKRYRIGSFVGNRTSLFDAYGLNE